MGSFHLKKKNLLTEKDLKSLNQPKLRVANRRGVPKNTLGSFTNEKVEVNSNNPLDNKNSNFNIPTTVSATKSEVISIFNGLSESPSSSAPSLILKDKLQKLSIIYEGNKGKKEIICTSFPIIVFLTDSITIKSLENDDTTIIILLSQIRRIKISNFKFEPLSLIFDFRLTEKGKINGEEYNIKQIMITLSIGGRSVYGKIKDLVKNETLKFEEMDSNEINNLLLSPFFRPSDPSSFYASDPLSKPNDNSFKTDFSSLKNMTTRSHRVGKIIKYDNEDLEDSKANEQMISDNISTGEVLTENIPIEDQIVLDPSLKYKIDDKKMFVISNNDFKCLYNGNWVNDSIVDFFLSYNLKIAQENGLIKNFKFEILNSFFFTKLTRKVENDDYYQNVKSWFKLNDRLFDKDFIIIPIMQDLHWYFVVITNLKKLKKFHLPDKSLSIIETNDLKDENENGDRKPKRSAHIFVLDSLRRQHVNIGIYLKSFLIGYAKDKYSINISTSEISKYICSIPQQKNFNDCGLHVVFNIKTFLFKPKEFSSLILVDRRRKKSEVRLTNQVLFDVKERLSLREDMREILLNLLREQVEREGGDSSKIGRETNRTRGNDNMSNSTLDNEKANHIDDDADDDDELVILHEKTVPIPITNIPASEPKKLESLKKKTLPKLIVNNNRAKMRDSDLLSTPDSRKEKSQNIDPDWTGDQDEEQKQKQRRKQKKEQRNNSIVSSPNILEEIDRHVSPLPPPPRQSSSPIIKPSDEYSSLSQEFIKPNFFNASINNEYVKLNTSPGILPSRREHYTRLNNALDSESEQDNESNNLKDYEIKSENVLSQKTYENRKAIALLSDSPIKLTDNFDQVDDSLRKPEKLENNTGNFQNSYAAKGNRDIEKELMSSETISSISSASIDLVGDSDNKSKNSQLEEDIFRNHKFGSGLAITAIADSQSKDPLFLRMKLSKQEHDKNEGSSGNEKLIDNKESISNKEFINNKESDNNEESANNEESVNNEEINIKKQFVPYEGTDYENAINLTDDQKAGQGLLAKIDKMDTTNDYKYVEGVADEAAKNENDKRSKSELEKSTPPNPTSLKVKTRYSTRSKMNKISIQVDDQDNEDNTDEDSMNFPINVVNKAYRKTTRKARDKYTETKRSVELGEYTNKGGILKRGKEMLPESHDLDDKPVVARLRDSGIKMVEELEYSGKKGNNTRNKLTDTEFSDETIKADALTLKKHGEYSRKANHDLKPKLEPGNNNRNLREKNVEVISIDCNEDGDEDDVDVFDKDGTEIEERRIDLIAAQEERNFKDKPIAGLNGILYPILSNSDSQNKASKSKLVSQIEEKGRSKNESDEKVPKNYDSISENEATQRDSVIISIGDKNDELEMKKGKRGRKRGRPKKSIDSRIPLQTEETVNSENKIKDRRHLRSSSLNVIEARRIDTLDDNRYKEEIITEKDRPRQYPVIIDIENDLEKVENSIDNVGKISFLPETVKTFNKTRETKQLLSSNTVSERANIIENSGVNRSTKRSRSMVKRFSSKHEPEYVYSDEDSQLQDESIDSETDYDSKENSVPKRKLHRGRSSDDNLSVKSTSAVNSNKKRGRRNFESEISDEALDSNFNYNGAGIRTRLFEKKSRKQDFFDTKGIETFKNGFYKKKLGVNNNENAKKRRIGKLVDDYKPSNFDESKSDEKQDTDNVKPSTRNRVLVLDPQSSKSSSENLAKKQLLSINNIIGDINTGKKGRYGAKKNGKAFDHNEVNFFGASGPKRTISKTLFPASVPTSTTGLVRYIPTFKTFSGKYGTVYNKEEPEEEPSPGYEIDHS